MQLNRHCTYTHIQTQVKYNYGFVDLCKFAMFAGYLFKEKKNTAKCINSRKSEQKTTVCCCFFLNNYFEIHVTLSSITEIV